MYIFTTITNQSSIPIAGDVYGACGCAGRANVYSARPIDPCQKPDDGVLAMPGFTRTLGPLGLRSRKEIIYVVL
jgi:hypothetical protein